MSPVRIQRRRIKGYRMPEGAVYVGRPSRWGNNLSRVNPKSDTSRRVAARHYENWARVWYAAAPVDVREAFLAPLRGRDLACWCPLDQPCHADVLLELANR